MKKSGEAILHLLINLIEKPSPLSFRTLWMCCENEIIVENHLLVVCANK
jgi:hypothetical protein